jgi:peptide subunit release factor 1 (eRF1)
MENYLGEIYEDNLKKTVEELIEECGTTRGLAIYLAVHSVEALENGFCNIRTFCIL